MKRYPKISINGITLNKTDWVVTEKIHDANFGIMTDGYDGRVK